MSQYESPYYGGGGGYIASQSVGGSPGGAIKRSGIDKSLRPVTIKQLREATQAHADAEWHIDEIEIGPVTVVAMVIKIVPQTTNCMYDLDDGTGTIQARHWVDSSQTAEDDTIKEQTYVRVMGNLKSFGNQRFINATHIRPVVDEHETYFHTLEACTVNLILQRGPPPRPGQELKPRVNGVPNGTSPYAAQGSAAPQRDQYAHLPPIQRNIINFILSQPNHTDGVHVAAIARAVGGDANAISAALDKLMDDGLVYTTIDESHFDVSL
ncbi:replication protein A, subunit RPA32 [Trametopsis cervina]|nr:replication protein A, subunit RPA32 [Trametopsis cervina]